MAWWRRGKAKAEEQSPLKLLLWTALAGIAFGLIGFGEIAEDWLRISRNSLHKHQASGDIILVTFDDASLKEVGRWPWPRRRHAEIVDNLSNAGAKRIFFDVSFFGPTNPYDDGKLAKALKRSGRVVLPTKAAAYARDGGKADQQIQTSEIFAQHAATATISVPYNYQNASWRIPYARMLDGKVVPSFAALLANKSGPVGASFIPDYSTDPQSFPTLSAAQVIKGDIPRQMIAGKDVLVGITSDAAGDQYFIPGYGKMGGVFIHAMGAETLKRGTPVNLGWVPALLIALLAALLALTGRRTLVRSGILGGTALALLALPIPMEINLISADVTPALFVLGIVGVVLARRRFRKVGLVNAVSGLPNLAALRANREGRHQAIIGVRILNYAEIVASLPADREQQLVEQIVSRLTVGAGKRVLYHGDGGIFAWFEGTREPFGHHLEALAALFRNPARIGDLMVDLTVAFGVEIGSGRSLGNRLASALVAAEEAAHSGLKWKLYDPNVLEDASWRLSILSQLDAAVDKGEVWVAYQPQLDLRSRRIVGAEALARWTHPEKGPIAASEFVAAAEQHDRIAKLTDFVLERAIEAGAIALKYEPDFSVAANLSARLLNDPDFKSRLAGMLARHRYPARLLTLELTETATLAESGAAVDMLASLRDLGVTISIDDYGTGLSTLEYLKKIPASEIKIDQSFVRGMLENRSDRLMVQSTITLAHALGRRVVAEGVERKDILQALMEMDCDLAQGYVIGRPMNLDGLLRRIANGIRTQVA